MDTTRGAMTVPPSSRTATPGRVDRSRDQLYLVGDVADQVLGAVRVTVALSTEMTRSP
jgi:hypothetical protein